MTTKKYSMSIGDLTVEIVRKKIKNLHVGVYPPQGRVRVAAPPTVSDEAVRLAVITRLGWIKRQIESFRDQARQTQREMVNGESHYYLGRRYRLRVFEQEGPVKVSIRGSASLDLYVRPGMSAEQREQVLQTWYRRQLRKMILPLLEKWQTKLNAPVSEWGIKKMKTKWGSCNADARRVWFNLELAKKPPECLEYIVVHELVHLLERKHGDRFTAIMDQFLPQWRTVREELNRSPLVHERWEY